MSVISGQVIGFGYGNNSRHVKPKQMHSKPNSILKNNLPAGLTRRIKHKSAFKVAGPSETETTE